jgi:hypothetical protein
VRTGGFKGILLSALIVVSLATPLLTFLMATSATKVPSLSSTDSGGIIYASPAGNPGEPIQIKVKVFVLECRENVTDKDIDDRLAEANETLKDSGIRLVRGPIHRGVPGNARSLENRNKIRKFVEENMKAENFKGIALIIAHENSIDDNENIWG